MREVIQNRPARVTVALTDSTDGSVKTGVTPGDITLYYRKPGALTAIQKSIDASNFREIDATNLPGLYEVLFTAEELSARGEFVAVLHANGGINLAQTNINVKVVEHPEGMLDEQTDDLMEAHREHSEFIGYLPPLGASTIFAYFQHKGEPVKGLTGNSDQLEAQMINYSSNGSISGYNAFTGNWTEIDSFYGDGWYKFDMPESWKPDAGDFGHLRFAPLRHLRVGHHNSNTFDVADMYAYQLSDGSWDGLFTVGYSTSSSSGYASARTDGVNWSGGYVTAKDFYAVDGDGTANNVFAVGEDAVVYEWNGSSWDFNAYWGASNTHLYGVSCYDATHTWACGVAEEIVLYNGTSHTQQNTGGTRDLQSIYAIDDQLVYAVGGDLTNGPVMMVTEDGGTTWTEVTSRLPNTASNEWCRSITFDKDQPNRGVVATSIGSGSTTANVYYTEDTGRTWEQLSFEVPTSSMLTHASINAERIVAVGQDMTSGDPKPPVVYETENLGGKWTVVNTHSNTTDPEVVFSAPDDSKSYIGAGGGEVLQTPANTVRFEPVNLRFIVGDVPADLSAVLTDLDDIKGGFNWNGTTDSLPALSDAITGVDLSPVITAIDEVKGPNFDVLKDSLSERYSALPYAGSVAQSNSATITVQVGDQTGLLPEDLSAELYKGGTQTATNLLTTWQEVDSSNAPGLYRFTLSNVDTDTLGDLLVRIKSANQNTEFVGLEFQDIGNFVTVGLAAVTAKDTQTLYAAKPGENNDGWTPPVVWGSTDGGSNWSDITSSIFADSIAFNTALNRLVADPNSDYLAALFTDVSFGTDSALTLYTGTSTAGLSQADLTTGLYDNLPHNGGLQITTDSGGVPVVYYLGTDVAGSVYSVAKWDGTSGDSTIIRDGTTGDEGYLDLAVIDDQTAVVVGAYPISSTPSALILKTTDGGTSWTPVYDPGTAGEAIYRVAFDSTGQYGFATGHNGSVAVIYYTTDGGDTWTKAPATTIPSPPMAGIHVVDEDVFIFGTQSDQMFVSEDQGTTITEIDLSSVSSGELTSISGFSQQVFGAFGGGFQQPTHSLVHYGYAYTTIDDVQLKLNVKEATSNVDLTPVTASLNEIKGATFDTNTDSLVQARSVLDNHTSSLSTIDNDVKAVKASAARILGLSQENIRITGQTYDANNNLTNSTITLYGSAADVGTETNPIAVYQLVAEYDTNNRLIDYRIVKTA